MSALDMAAHEGLGMQLYLVPVYFCVGKDGEGCSKTC